jgi:hypothetical protein
MPSAAPTDFRSLNDILTAATEGRMAPRSTVEMSMDHPELQREAAVVSFVDSLNSHQIHLQRNVRMSPLYVYVRPSTPYTE